MPKLEPYALVLAAVLCLAPFPAIAQVTTGTLVGTVRDPNGVVPGASVVVREVNKGTADTPASRLRLPTFRCRWELEAGSWELDGALP
jgi:hypothetical protein